MRRFIILHPGWAMSVFAVFVVVAVVVGLGISVWVGQLESVKGGEISGHRGGAKVYHQGSLASLNVRTNCSGGMSL